MAAERASLRIATKASPPLAFDCGLFTLKKSRVCPKPGIEHEFLAQVLRSMKMDYELVPLGKGNWGSPAGNGSWSGLLGEHDSQAKISSHSIGTNF